MHLCFIPKPRHLQWLFDGITDGCRTRSPQREDRPFITDIRYNLLTPASDSASVNTRHCLENGDINVICTLGITLKEACTLWNLYCSLMNVYCIFLDCWLLFLTSSLLLHAKLTFKEVSVHRLSVDRISSSKVWWKVYSGFKLK